MTDVGELDPTLRHHVERTTAFATLTQLLDVQKDVRNILSLVKGEIDETTGNFKPGIISRLVKVESIYARVEKGVLAIASLLGAQLLIQLTSFYFDHVVGHLWR